ncbi:mitochondrial inner-membrane-bound regulator-domain-containing protein [Daldinia caldariorum]|uniref:mitochondrial inner-membrane-bound regulator-domain-containing protein n=1 Tax=Daldinia caldariorum TaxID=326644 RepID=UPI0020080D6D|nr:mitochondrial inner-membrane-bound regulator-domain-containing protein [Daldinia caldariorum]KAI1472274.1 mitochondrial inner-membrane-bound regulator-domain-containing protein [Daldinia caldariorum]
MLAAKVTGGAICLRCRLRLLRQTPQLFQISSQFVRNQRSILQRFYSNSSALPTDEDLSPENEGLGLENKNEGGHHRKREHGRGRGVKSLDLRKKRLSRNRILEEASGSLDIGMLGKPASVIIMKDEGPYRKKGRRPYVPEDPDEGTGNKPANLEALLKLQRETPTIEEVYAGLDGLKPKSETTMPEREFRKLQAELMDGFLSPQLYGYLEYYKKKKRHSTGSNPADKLLADVKKYSWVRNISPWAPLGTRSTPVEGIDASLQGYATESTLPKEALALRIMRECWGLSITELDARLGEMKIKIQNKSFLLLMRGTRKWMNGIDDTWFGPGEKIEATRSKLTIRIVATKTKTLTLIQRLAKMLKEVTYIISPRGFVVQERLDEAALEEIGRITNTHVSLIKSTGNCRITWIDTEGPTDLTSQGDEACRLLLTGSNPQPATTRTLMVAGLENKPPGRFVMNTTSKERLAWNYRSSAWARYILPVTSEESNPATENPLGRLQLPIISLPQTPISGEPLEPATDMQPSSYKRVGWTSEYQISTIAQFGTLLHANNPSATPPALPGLLVANHPRVFAASTPHAVQLTSLNTGTQPVETKSSVVLRFWPTPAQNEMPGKKQRKPHSATAFPPAPLLELRLSVSGNKIKGIESLRAIRREHVTDVMLPACPVDLRFTQDEYVVPSDDISKSASWEPLHTFLASSHLDLERGRLKTPPRRRFSVPWHPLSWSTSKDSADFTPSPDSRTPLSIETEYTLASLEIHRSISTLYEGFKLSYTSIEAGPESRQGAEVTLEPTVVSGGNINSRKLHDEFLAACHKLASTDTFWTGL